MNDTKNKIISDAIKATRLKRKSQLCKTFRFKVDKSSLTREQRNALKMFFVEAKRVYNYILGAKLDPFSITYKDVKEIKYLDKDKNEVPYKIQYIGSSVIDDTITIMKDSIKGISALKKKGYNVGGLRFKSECNSIRLRQYGVTHYIKGSRFKIQGIKKPIRVNGLKQLDKYDNIDYTVAHILYNGYDYFITLTCFIDIESDNIINNKINNNTQRKDVVGLDLGCMTTMALSNGDKIDVKVEESERLKGLQRRLEKQQKGSNNRNKTKSLIRKEYAKQCNKKNDITNKIVYNLISQYNTIVIQDDQLNEWKDTKYKSKAVQHSILGRVKNKLRQYSNVVVLDNWFPTTQHYFECGHDTRHELSDRTFECSNCHITEDRDLHGAKNMILYYREVCCDKEKQPAGTVGLKPGRKVKYKKSYKGLLKTGSSIAFSN